jgi:hypothetical protein
LGHVVAAAEREKPDLRRSLVAGTKTFVDRVDEIATAGLCAVITLAPLPFGSADPKAIAIWVLLLSAIVVLAGLRALNSRDLAFLLSCAILAVSWGFVVTEQLSRAPLWPDLINPIWPQTETLIGHELNGTITLARDQPYLSAGSQIALMLSVVGGFLLGRNRNAAYRLLLTFAGSGLAYLRNSRVYSLAGPPPMAAKVQLPKFLDGHLLQPECRSGLFWGLHHRLAADPSRDD